jgi:two-component system, OmpR family, alkaline phosphatase synthesis response regulator PhoP
LSKILIVEDDPSSRRLLEYILKKADYEVISASNGLQGLRKARDEKPDMVILDIMLPGIDGYEVCDRLRSEEETANLPIMMLSSKVREIDKETGLKIGADDYLSKPAPPSVILQKVKAILESRNRETAAEGENL